MNNQKTFKDDGYKRVKCNSCWHFLMETHLGDKYTKRKDCKKCGNIQIIAPPRLGQKDGESGAFWGPPGDSCFTAIPE
jgi:ribosomal protein S27E